MLQSMGLQRIGHDLVTEQQSKGTVTSGEFLFVCFVYKYLLKLRGVCSSVP